MNKSEECNNVGTTPKPPYRPVVIVHGLMTGDVSTMQHLASHIAKLHPGTKTYVIDRFCGLASLEPLWRQTKLLADDLLRACSLHPEGVHVIGYSQGGLIARGMLEVYGDQHNVRTFISLSSPQGGQYGAECFTKMFPALTTRTAYEIFYTRLGQHALSVANYWYDPRHRDLYLKYSVYLAVIDNVKSMDKNSCLQHQPVVTKVDSDSNSSTDIQSMTTCNSITDSTIVTNINNETKSIIEKNVKNAITAVVAATVKVAEGLNYNDNGVVENVTTTAAVDDILANAIVNKNDCPYNQNSDDKSLNANSNIMKLGLTRLQRLVLIGGPDDGVITPWQSSQFAVLDSTGELVQMRQRQNNDIYSENDPIGLRQLDKTGRLIEYTVPGILHHEWHRNKKVLHECIINWLD